MTHIKVLMAERLGNWLSNSIYEYLGYGSPAFVCISFREISQFFAQIQVNQVSTYDNPDRYYKISKKLAELVKYFEMGYTSLNLGDVIGKVWKCCRCFWNLSFFCNFSHLVEYVWTTVQPILGHISTKVSFFWDHSQDKSSRSFLPRKQISDWLTNLIYQLEVCFFWPETTWTPALTQISEKTDFKNVFVRYFFLKVSVFFLWSRIAFWVY